MEDHFKAAIPSTKQMIKDVWKTAPGKIFIVSLAGFAGMAIVAGFFKAAAYTLHQFKDFRDALRR